MNTWFERLLQRDPLTLAALLMAASFLIHIAATNLAWRTGRLAARQLTPPGGPYGRALYEAARAVFYLGTLYLALLWGWIDLRAVGLGPVGIAALDWGSGLAWTLVLGLGAWGLLVLIWLPYLRATSSLALEEMPERPSLPRRLLEVFYMQAHWALYRSVLTLVLNNVYWGTLGGLGAALLEGWCDPSVRRRLAIVGQLEVSAWNAGMAIVSTLTYLVTLNLWLVALLHLLLEVTVPHLPTARVARPPIPQPGYAEIVRPRAPALPPADPSRPTR